MSDVVNDHAPRLAVLEQIARSTQAALERIETRLDRIEARQADDFRFLVRMQITLTTVTIGLMMLALLGVIARGFHWI
jgi:hypothetical protein